MFKQGYGIFVLQVRIGWIMEMKYEEKNISNNNSCCIDDSCYMYIIVV